jgi:HAE1 family hydrophobic/amphiphilic exporter-1
VASVVRSKVLGAVVTDITREDRTIDIRLRAQEQYRNSARDLRNLNVAQAGATAIPLSAVAEVTETVGPAEIRRADGERIASISANLDGRDLGSASQEIQRALGAIASRPASRPGSAASARRWRPRSTACASRCCSRCSWSTW